MSPNFWSSLMDVYKFVKTRQKYTFLYNCDMEKSKIVQKLSPPQPLNFQYGTQCWRRMGQVHRRIRGIVVHCRDLDSPAWTISLALSTDTWSPWKTYTMSASFPIYHTTKNNILPPSVSGCLSVWRVGRLDRCALASHCLWSTGGSWRGLWLILTPIDVPPVKVSGH